MAGHFRLEHDSGEALGRAFYAYRRELWALAKLHKPTTICFEAALSERLHGLHASLLLVGLGAITELTAFELGLETFACDVLTIRKHFCGNGRAQKADVLARCRLLGWEAATHDEADALAGWAYAHDTLRQGEIEAKAARQWA